MALVAKVTGADVYVVRSKDGFWTYLSALTDGSWLVEYEPRFERRGDKFMVLGPYGARERLPDSYPLENVGRVPLAHVDTAREARTGRLLASLLAARALTLPELEAACEAPTEPLRGVLYELLDKGERTGTLGSVHHYADGDVFQTETGDEVPLDDVAGRLWPAGGHIDPE